MGFEPIETEEKLDEIVNAAVEKEQEKFKGWLSPEKVSEQTSGYTVRLETAENDLAAAKLENAKLKAAMKFGLSPELSERIRGATSEEITEDAEKLSKLLKVSGAKSPPLADPEKGLADDGESKETAAYIKLLKNLT